MDHLIYHYIQLTRFHQNLQNVPNFYGSWKVDTQLMFKTMIKIDTAKGDICLCIQLYIYILNGENAFLTNVKWPFPIKLLYPVTLRETHWNNKVPFSALTGINQYICINSSILRGYYTRNAINKNESRSTLLRHNKGWGS